MCILLFTRNLSKSERHILVWNALNEETLRLLRVRPTGPSKTAITTRNECIPDQSFLVIFFLALQERLQIKSGHHKTKGNANVLNISFLFFLTALLWRCAVPNRRTQLLIYFAVVIYYPWVFAISFSSLNGVSVFPCN